MLLPQRGAGLRAAFGDGYQAPRCGIEPARGQIEGRGARNTPQPMSSGSASCGIRGGDHR